MMFFRRRPAYKPRTELFSPRCAFLMMFFRQRPAYNLAQSWMHRHFGDPIRIDDLAQRSGLSQRSFQRRFQRACGQSPLQYQQQIRLDSARELLQNSNLPVEEISALCGYNDASYFSKLFKQMNAIAPGQFRQNVRRKLFSADDRFYEGQD